MLTIEDDVSYVVPFLLCRVTINAPHFYIFRALSVSEAHPGGAEGGGGGGGVPASLKARWSEGVGRTGGWQDCADGRALVQSMPIRGSHKSWALLAGLCQQSTE